MNPLDLLNHHLDKENKDSDIKQLAAQNPHLYKIGIVDGQSALVASDSFQAKINAGIKRGEIAADKGFDLSALSKRF